LSSPRTSDRIRSLGSDTAVYGVSTILGRFLTFLLTPLYTHVLVPGDLGIVANVYAYIALLNVVYGYGMESAYMKYVSTLEVGTKRQVFSIPFVAVACTATLFSLAIILNASRLGDVVSVPVEWTHLLVYGAAILLLDALALIPFAALRMERKARTFAAIKLGGIGINVVLNVVLLFSAHLGIEGIFISNLVSSALTLAMLTPTIVDRFAPGWHSGLFRALLRFGLPTVPAGFAAMLVQVVNRPILESLKGSAAVGIFQANYRLGIFMMLLVSMFDFAWRPFFFAHANDADARQLFARIMTYVVLVMTTVFVALTLFLPDFVRAPIWGGHPLIAEPYWTGIEIIPVILLAYVFLGVYNNLVAGIYIQKRTELLPAVTILSAAVNVAANFALIPLYGLMGAAIATLISYALQAGILALIERRVYPVPYERDRLVKIVLSAVCVYGASMLLPSGAWGIAGRFALSGIFVLLLHLLRFFKPGELQAVADLVRRRTPVAPPGSPPPPPAD
jgi:O-antigen/teichoic acid export membrane protein